MARQYQGIWGSTLLKIIICIKSGTLPGNILGGVVNFFVGGGGGLPPAPQKRKTPPGSPEYCNVWIQVFPLELSESLWVTI